jgi:molybdenum cofactor cytidylyltransferase
VIVPTCGGRRGNPALFPADLLPSLAALSGERGGRAILDAVPDRIVLVETADPAVVTDVDTTDALAAVEAALAIG